MGRCRVPRSTSFRDFFHKTEDHTWRYRHRFQPETSMSRPPASCFCRSLIILRPESWPAKLYCIRFVRVLVYRSFASLRSHGGLDRQLVRTGPSSASRLFGCQQGNNFTPHPIIHTFFRIERKYFRKTF